MNTSTTVSTVILVLIATHPVSADFQAIDNFDSRDLGPLNGQGNWNIASIFEVAVDPDDPSNQLMSVSDSGGVQDGYFDLETPLPNGDTGTLFFRFRTTHGLSHMNWGLSDVEAPTGEWFHFESQIRDAQDNNMELDFRDGGGFNQLAVELEEQEWYKVWMVIDNDNDETMGFVQSEESFPELTILQSAADQSQLSFQFRNGTEDPLITFYIRAGNNHQDEWLLDDIYFDVTGANLNDPTQGLAGDFNDDGTLNVPDIDLLNQSIATGANEAAFDLNGDGLVNLADQTDWLSQAAINNGLAGPYLPGDTNLDGIVNATDLNEIGISWLGNVATWSGGDLSADGVVNATDLNLLGLNWQASSPVAAQAVPEPNAMVLTLLAGMIGFGFLRKTAASKLS